MYKHVNRQTLIYNLFTIIKSLWKNGTELNIVSVTIGYVSLLHLRFQVHQKLCLDLIFFLNKRKVFYLGVMSRHLITGNTSSALIFRNSTVFGLIFYITEFDPNTGNQWILPSLSYSYLVNILFILFNEHIHLNSNRKREIELDRVGHTTGLFLVTSKGSRKR